MKLFIGNQLTDAENCIDGVMFCMLASSAIDHVFKPSYYFLCVGSEFG